MYVDFLPDARDPRSWRVLCAGRCGFGSELYIIEDGRVRDSMRVIVGKPETPTPALKSVINYETLNPYWHVTPDLAQTLIAPRVLKEGDAYLTTGVTRFSPAWDPMRRCFRPTPSTGKRSPPAI